MKVLDVDLFQDGLQRNIAMLDRLRSEIEAIHRSVEGLVQMEDMLKGEGGNAIRSFYGECHLPFLQFFQLFSENFKQVLQQMEAALYSLEPDSAGYILEQFLEGELEQGLTLIGRLTASLTDETNSIMDQVSDIIGLPHLDDSGVQEGVIHSIRKRDDTVMQLHEFDATQTNALNPIEQDMQTMETWLADLEGLFKDGLTDIHFHQSEWAKNPRRRLEIELVARQLGIQGLSHDDSLDKQQQLISIFRVLLEYEKPILFGFGGLINIQNPFVGSDMIALSCPKPERNMTEKEKINQNPIIKSLNSFKEIAMDFWDGLGMRAEKSLNSPYDFINYMTLGITDGIWSGAKDRADKMFESKTDFTNYATFGLSGMLKEAVFPEESFSKEHWQSSFGVVGSIFGFGKLVKFPMSKTSEVIPKGMVNSRYTYNMIENPGPLVDINPGAASTFRSGMYNVTKLEIDTILYRSGKAGGGKNALGQYFTREPGTIIEGRIDSAVKAQWIDPKTGVLTGSSPLDTVYGIKIPKGTTIYEGPVGNQGGIYLGGGNQIFVPEPWKIKGVEVISSSPIR